MKQLSVAAGIDPSKVFAIEGIIVIDDKMYILNDGKYHKAKMQDSYIAVYDL